MIVYSWPAIAFNGFGILTHLQWNLGNQYGTGVEHRGGFTGSPGASFGAVVFILGTIISSAFAMAIATPLAILVAIAMHYQVPRRLKTPVNTLVELMAGVPSVVYGLWGIGVLVPWISNSVGPFLAAHISWLPIIGGGSASGNGLLATSFILSVMVFPIMAATMRDVLSTFPKIVFEGAIGLGATPWQAVTTMVLPAIRTQMFAAAMLALGRAHRRNDGSPDGLRLGAQSASAECFRADQHDRGGDRLAARQRVDRSRPGWPNDRSPSWH